MSRIHHAFRNRSEKHFSNARYNHFCRPSRDSAIWKQTTPRRNSFRANIFGKCFAGKKSRELHTCRTKSSKITITSFQSVHVLRNLHEQNGGAEDVRGGQVENVVEIRFCPERVRKEIRIFLPAFAQKDREHPTCAAELPICSWNLHLAPSPTLNRNRSN